MKNPGKGHSAPASPEDVRDRLDALWFFVAASMFLVVPSSALSGLVALALSLQGRIPPLFGFLVAGASALALLSLDMIGLGSCGVLGPLSGDLVRLCRLSRCLWVPMLPGSLAALIPFLY